jgi:hypothetical protein
VGKKGTLDSEGEFGEEDDSFEGYEPEYHPEEDDPGVFWCPKCGAEMYGDSTRCPKCGDFVTPGARPSGSAPWWIWAGAIAIGITLLAGLIAAILR